MMKHVVAFDVREVKNRIDIEESDLIPTDVIHKNELFNCEIYLSEKIPLDSLKILNA